MGCLHSDVQQPMSTAECENKQPREHVSTLSYRLKKHNNEADNKIIKRLAFMERKAEEISKSIFKLLEALNINYIISLFETDHQD